MNQSITGQTLKITSCMAPNMHFFCRQLTDYLSQSLQRPIEFIDTIPWQDAECQLDRGEIQVGWICGTPYVWKADQAQPSVELLAAPVMQADRYADRPVYFSDVMVRQDSPYRTFTDLRGVTWAYNEPRSHSGFYVTRYHLATLNETDGFLGQAIESGAHQTSLRLILSGAVDASAIDSTVLALELQRFPDLAPQLRCIASLGPSPMPPWVVSTQLSPTLRSTLRHAFLQMHLHPQGQAILTQGGFARFAAVSDRDYDPIRQMVQVGEGVRLVRGEVGEG